ncbi:MAG: DUF4476 domain-containing protein [Chitinophagales bacterium]
MQKLRLFGMNGFFTLMLACTAAVCRGQEAGYLILIDADNKQPFTARIGDNLMASTQHGYLIIPQLQDSSYRVCIRFPREAIPEQIFPVRVNKKDRGFQLQGSDSSWVLYNWQSKEVIHALKEVDSSRVLDQGVKRDDGFSRLMAAVVNDTSVMYNTYAGTGFSRDTRDTKDTATTAKTIKPDSIAIVTSPRKKTPVDSVKLEKPPPEVLVAKSLVIKPEIRKLREVSLKVSRKMVFLDASPEGSRDTITLFVYFETADVAGKKKPHEDPMVTARRLLKGDTASKKIVLKGKEKETVPVTETVKTTLKDTIRTLAKDTVKTRVSDSAMAPVACHQEASDPDVEALRSAILVANTLQDKISVASGAFIMKCFSVSQLKVLEDLFVSDMAKYRFLDAAYGHVSDPDHFRDLSETIMDKTYKKKFRVLMQRKG